MFLVIGALGGLAAAYGPDALDSGGAVGPKTQTGVELHRNIGGVNGQVELRSSEWTPAQKGQTQKIVDAYEGVKSQPTVRERQEELVRLYENSNSGSDH